MTNNDMIYKLICANGAEVQLTTEERLSLEQLQGLVGGYIEFTPADRHGGNECEEFCVNEDGLGNLPLNAKHPTLAGNIVVGKKMTDDDGLAFVGIK